jgi:hypothetical protein
MRELKAETERLTAELERLGSIARNLPLSDAEVPQSTSDAMPGGAES